MKLDLLPSGSFLGRVEEWAEEVDPLNPDLKLFMDRNVSCGAEQGKYDSGAVSGLGFRV